MEGRRWNPDLAATYDRVAQAYADHFFTELDRKPFDRELLDRFAASVAGRGRVCDVGCGPGHVRRYLAGRGVDVLGLDLSPGMVALTRDLNPAMHFEQGDMLAVDLPDGALAGAVAFYSLIHLERATVVQALAEMARVLIPGGALGGEGEVHAEDWFGCGVSVDATLFRLAEMATYMEQAGFEVEEVVTREPYEFEHPSQRVYARGAKRP